MNTNPINRGSIIPCKTSTENYFIGKIKSITPNMSLNLFKNGDSKYHDIIDMTRVLTRLSVTMTGVNLTLYYSET